MAATMHEHLPRLSVVMVVRNAVGSVARALDSLVAQRYPNLELIVWDGQSTDGTLEVLKRYAHVITVLKSERDQSSPDGCNQAVPLATGDYVGFLYADDEYEPGYLWAVADAIDKHPGTDVISCGTAYYRFVHGVRTLTGYYAHPSQLALTLATVLTDLPTFVLSRFFRRGVFGPLNIDYPCANDRDLLARLALIPVSNVVVPHALYGFLVADNTISNNPKSYRLIIEEHLRIAADLLARPDVTPAQCRVIERWRTRQIVFGLGDACRRFHFEGIQRFLRLGFETDGWRFGFSSKCILARKLFKRIGLALSGGIDRGMIIRTTKA